MFPSRYPHSLILFILYSFILLFLVKKNLKAQESCLKNDFPSIIFLFREAKYAEKQNNDQLALEDYKKILIINPKNKKALREIAKIKNANKKLHQERQQETRTLLLQDVDKTWLVSSGENNLHAQDIHKKKYNKHLIVGSNSRDDRSSLASETVSEKRNFMIEKLTNRENPVSDAMTVKLQSLIIPTIDFEDATLSEAIDYLRQQSRALDESNKGINIVLNLPLTEKKESPNVEQTGIPVEPHISLELHEVPMYVALEYVAKQAGLSIRIDPYAVVLLPELEAKEDFITKEYIVTSPFLSNKQREENKEQTDSLAKDFLEHEGVIFPEGSCANYLNASHKLIVRNTKENMDLIDIFMASSQDNTSSQISIETKFIEVSQDQLERLGLSWLLGALQLGNSSISLSGGREIAQAHYAPGLTRNINAMSELQSENTAIQENSIDAVIDQGISEANSTGPSSSLFSIEGIYTNPQFQVVLQALHQKKGIDLMAAPHVTTKNGMKATVKIVDEFIYPTEYTPPQIPQSTTNSGGNTLHEAPPTIAPSFPNTWTKRDLGVLLEAKPTIGPDGHTIDLELHPQTTDFDGFINYGSPIYTVGYNFSINNASATPFSSILTTNTINQPVFTVREVNTSVTVYDGQTLVLGGLIREDVQKVEDKIPLLGNIPLAGKLFRHKSNKRIKKNLIIFVTPKILNEDGSPLINNALPQK